MIQTYSTKQAAQALGCSERTIRDMIQRGSIHAEKIDPTSKSVYSISKAEIERIIKLRSAKIHSTKVRTKAS
jgi:excisionase family DNA binding protein